MKQVAVAGALVVALAGIVGGVAYAAQPAEQVAPMVVVPEADPIVSTGTPTPTGAVTPSAVPVVKAPAPKPSAAPVKAAPKPVAKPVAPAKKATPVSSKRTVVKKATTTTSSRSLTVASDPAPADPTPVDPAPTQPAAPAVPQPPMPTGLTPNTFTGQAGGDAPKVNAGN